MIHLQSAFLSLTYMCSKVPAPAHLCAFLHRSPMNLQQPLLSLPASLQGTLHPAAETAALVHIGKWHCGRLDSAA